jgi:hypothetical protein
MHLFVAFVCTALAIPVWRPVRQHAMVWVHLSYLVPPAAAGTSAAGVLVQGWVRMMGDSEAHFSLVSKSVLNTLQIPMDRTQANKHNIVSATGSLFALKTAVVDMEVFGRSVLHRMSVNSLDCAALLGAHTMQSLGCGIVNSTPKYLARQNAPSNVGSVAKLKA